MSKGSKRRPVKDEDYRDGWDRIFKNKDECVLCLNRVPELKLYCGQLICINCYNAITAEVDGNYFRPFRSGPLTPG